MNEQATEKDVEVSEAEADELEVTEPTEFVTKAMIFESSALVHSVLTLPADFEMPGFCWCPSQTAQLAKQGCTTTKRKALFPLWKNLKKQMKS
jgi:hypothetical protein